MARDGDSSRPVVFAAGLATLLVLLGAVLWQARSGGNDPAIEPLPWDRDHPCDSEHPPPTPSSTRPLAPEEREELHQQLNELDDQLAEEWDGGDSSDTTMSLQDRAEEAARDLAEYDQRYPGRRAACEQWTIDWLRRQGVIDDEGNSITAGGPSGATTTTTSAMPVGDTSE